MSLNRDDLAKKIESMLEKNLRPRIISRRLFLFDQTQAFKSDPERGFEILNTISEYFSVPFSAVRIAGSAQLGYSQVKKRDFTPHESDVDIAIINSQLFESYVEYVGRFTRGYSDLSTFPRVNGVGTDRSFRDYLSLGFFRPDLMPYCEAREKWFSFFRNLSNTHRKYYKSINAGIFLSEALFEMRNESVVRNHRKAKND